nr:transposase, mutator type [Tanacetum cinerariifolium]
MNNDSDRFVDEQSMIEDVHVDTHPFKNDLEMNDTMVRICDIKQSMVDLSEAYLDVIDLDSFSNDLKDGINTKRRKILRELRKQGKLIDRGMLNFFGIIPAIVSIFPCVEHRLWLKNIHENMKLQWNDGNIKELLWNAATATTITEFEKKMKNLKAYNVGAYEYLNKISPE